MSWTGLVDPERKRKEQVNLCGQVELAGLADRLQLAGRGRDVVLSL